MKIYVVPYNPAFTPEFIQKPEPFRFRQGRRFGMLRYRLSDETIAQLIREIEAVGRFALMR